MKISTKGRYALRLMVDLAEHKESGFIALKEIEVDINFQKNLLNILLEIF